VAPAPMTGRAPRFFKRCLSRSSRPVVSRHTRQRRLDSGRHGVLSYTIRLVASGLFRRFLT
jgi:hypothetical protein